jgi:kynurenine formamidase
MPTNHTITAPPDLQPGVGPDCLACLHEMDMVAVGADTAAVAWGFPPIVGDTRNAYGILGLPFHVDFLWSRGAYLIEMLTLDALTRDQAYELLCVLGPLLLRGGIGVPVHPIAIRGRNRQRVDACRWDSAHPPALHHTGCGML